MAEFILLLNASPTAVAGVSPEEIQRIIEEYSAWRETLQGRGQLVSSRKLKDNSGKSLSMKNGKMRVLDGPFSEAKEVVGGFFVIQADNYDQAVEICRTCPHLKYGGTIELRQIELP